MTGDTTTQTTWNSLGKPGQLANSPTVAHNADGRLEVFLQTSDGTLWHIWQTSPVGSWSSWASLNKPAGVSNADDTVVGRNADGRLEIFTVNDGVLWHNWQATAGGSWNTAWFSSGQPPGAGLQEGLAVASNSDGRLEVFSGGSDGKLWHIWQIVANGTWSEWAALGAAIAPPVAASNSDGRLEVFTVDNVDGTFLHISQTKPGRNWNTTWPSLGHPPVAHQGPPPPSDPVVSQNADGRLEVFTLYPDGALWHIWQASPGGNWSAWDSLGTPPNTQLTTRLTVGRNTDGRLEVLITANDGALWHIVQNSAGGIWGTWDSLGSPPNTSLVYSPPTAAVNTDGRLWVFALGGDTLWYASQVSPGGPWA